MFRLLSGIIFLILFLFVVTFAVNNNGDVDLDLWPLRVGGIQFPVYGIGLIGLLTGFIIGLIVSWSSGGRSRSRVRELVRQSETDQREIARLQDMMKQPDSTPRQLTSGESAVKAE